MALTDIQIKRAKPQDKPYKLNDGQGLSLLINPDGSLTDRSKKVLAKTPMNRFGDIKELNGAVQFLCSEAASFVTGAMLPIDGGFSAFSGV